MRPQYTLRYSSGAHSHLVWTTLPGAEAARDRLRRWYPELGAVEVVPVPREHDLSPGHERLGG